jgi:hypothetical protein
MICCNNNNNSCLPNGVILQRGGLLQSSSSSSKIAVLGVPSSLITPRYIPEQFIGSATSIELILLLVGEDSSERLTVPCVV